MGSKTFFSVIIPTFNRCGFLKKAVESVLSQTFIDFELLIIDDGSTDNTKSLLSTYKDPRVKTIIFEKNRGVSTARNIGLKASQGEFIAFLDSDDYWTRDKLEKAVSYIKKYPLIKIFHTEEIWYRSGILLKQLAKHKKPTGYVYKNALPLCCISISTAVIKREVFDNVGIFDENLIACEDYDFWLRATNEYEVKLIPEELTIKDGGRKDQLSSKIWGLDRFRIVALEKTIKSTRLDRENYNATVDELKKKCLIFAKGARKHGKKKEAQQYEDLAVKYKKRALN